MYFLYDRLAQMKVTINGQLLILMLIEKLELANIHCVSANTDGIVVKLYDDQANTFKQITDKWCEYTKLTADSEEYDRYINRDINCYIIKELNGKVSYKGALNPKLYVVDLQKGYNMPIVAQAVSNYFIDDVPVMKTIMSCTNILDFCKTQNVNRKFKIEYKTVVNGEIVVKVQQKNCRYYISNHGGVLEKVSKIADENGNSSRSTLSSSLYCKVLNSLDDEPIEARDINYKYYYEQAMILINPIKLGISNKKKSRIKKNAGMYNPLFDFEEDGKEDATDI